MNSMQATIQQPYYTDGNPLLSNSTNYLENGNRDSVQKRNTRSPYLDDMIISSLLFSSSLVYLILSYLTDYVFSYMLLDRLSKGS